jgi:hypothetical protein
MPNAGAFPGTSAPGAYVLKPRMWGAAIHSPADEPMRLKDVICFCRGHKRPGFVKSVSPSEIELLEVIVSILELAAVQGIDAAPKGVVVGL